jgi:hypothetical protein
MIENGDVSGADKSIVSKSASTEINRHLVLVRGARIASGNCPNGDNSPDIENIPFEPQWHRCLTIDNQIMSYRTFELGSADY